MNWLWVIIVVAVIAAIFGYFSEDQESERGKAALGGAIAGGIGCGYLILQILLGVAVLWGIFMLFGWLFG